MRIAVNTRFLIPDQLEGIGWFTCETLRKITRQHPEHEFHFFFDRSYSDAYLFSDNIVPHVIHPPARHPVLWYWWFEWSVSNKLKQLKPDLFLSTDGFLSLSANVPTLLVIHDIAFEHYPQHVGRLARRFYRHYTPLYAKKAHRIITVSEFSKQDIAERYNLNPEKIDVVYNGANNDYQPLRKTQKDTLKQHLTGGKDYFLFAGALQPRKNVESLLKGFDEFKASTGSNMQLLIVGRKAWYFETIMHTYENMSYKADVQFLGHKSPKELSGIMGAAYALVYVSLFEGFGIPLLEAMYSETPVITSNTSSMPEVAGDAALLADPNSKSDIARAMARIAQDAELREQLIQKGRIQSQRFSWQKTADKLWASMQKTVGQLQHPVS